MNKQSKLFITLTVLLVISISVSVYSYHYKSSNSANGQTISQNQKAHKLFTAHELAKYDGTNPDLPIYLALDGYVYDVTAGKKFYQEGGTYHYLAGKDSTQELSLIGGDIIKSKYLVVGILNK